jgi:hypothetical protein
MTKYLILHKVRGESSFDVAIRTPCPVCRDRGEPCDDFNENTRHPCDNGYWWIIPTSGHRAYPCASWSIDELGLTVPDVPTALRDHYGANDLDQYGPLEDDDDKVKVDIGAVLSKLVKPIRRRI